MSSKRTLVKQKVTYGSVGEGNLQDSDDDFSGKRTLTKRVSFGSHELSESDSDAENSLGRINRASAGRTGDSLDGLFRETSAKEREKSVGLVKGTSEERYASIKGEPKPAPRPRPTISPRRSHFEGHSVTTSQQSSDEDGDDVSSVTWPVKTKEAKESRHPVVPPRTSPRQQQEKRSSPDMTSSGPVPRARPALSSREGRLKLFERDPDVEEYERTKREERDNGVYGYERGKSVAEKPMVPVRRKIMHEESHEKVFEVNESERTENFPVQKPIAPSRRENTVEETHEKRTEKDDGGYEYGRNKGVPVEKPMAPSRRKNTVEESHEKRRPKDDGVNEYERTKDVTVEKPMAPSRRKKFVEEAHENRRGKVDGVYEYERTKDVTLEQPMALSRRKKSFEETHEKRRVKDDRVYERTEDVTVEKPIAPLRRKQRLEETHEMYSRPQIPIIRTSTFEDDGSFQDSDRAEIEQYGNLRHGQSKKVKGRPLISVTRADSSGESEDEGDPGNVLYRKDSFGSKRYDKEGWTDDRSVTDEREKSDGVPPRPSPRSRSSIGKHAQLEEDVRHANRPGSAPAMKKASSLETLSSRQGTPAKKGPSGSKEHGSQRMQLKKSLTPQRPMSGKKGSLLAQLRQKAHADVTDTFQEHVPSTENVIGTAQDDRDGGRKWDVPTSQRSGPLKANQGIDTMTRSPHHRETPTDHWADTKGASHRGSLTPKRSSSMTNLRGTSPELWSGESSARSSQHSGLMDTSSIRQAVFDEWKSRKSAKLKEQVASKSAEKKKQEEKEQEERERKKMAKRAFESWNEMKQEQNKDVKAKRKELMEKELEEQTEKNLKARDAKKYFESWKTKKDEELKEKHQKKKEEGREKKRREEEEKREKSKSAQKVFDNWKNNKDEKIKEEAKKKRKEERESKMKQEDEKYEKSIQSAERYQEWAEKKGKPRKGPPPPTLTQRNWCPSGRKSGNCIPEKVGAVIRAPAPNRSRTMSGSYYL